MSERESSILDKAMNAAFAVTAAVKSSPATVVASKIGPSHMSVYAKNSGESIANDAVMHSQIAKFHKRRENSYMNKWNNLHQNSPDAVKKGNSLMTRAKAHAALFKAHDKMCKLCK